MTAPQNASRETAPAGEWITPTVSYVEPARRHCALCGRPIARQYWRATVNGTPQIFCTPEHETLYRDYWLPIYGRSQQG